MLLADDEKIILEGISNSVDWASLNVELIGTASNGIEAYEKIMLLKPDIVLTDIQMPGLDGIGLIEKVQDTCPCIQFILLSGYSEFEYARKAMKYGIKNYLLKPCNEDQIAQAVSEAKNDLVVLEENQQRTSRLKENLVKIKPYIQSQLLIDLLQETEKQQDLPLQEWLDLNVDTVKVQLCLIQFEGEVEFEHYLVMNRLGKEMLGTPLLNANIRDYVIYMVAEEDGLMERLRKIQEQYYTLHHVNVTIALSDANLIRHTKKMYDEVKECLKYRFYLGEGQIITKNCIQRFISDASAKPEIDEHKMTLYIKSGQAAEITTLLKGYFAEVKRNQPCIQDAKSYYSELYLSVIHLVGFKRMMGYWSEFIGVLNKWTMNQIEERILATVSEITKEFSRKLHRKQTTIIERVIDIMNEQFSDPDLTLKLVANHMLYMNPDYLGKLFKQETGERFSSYLTKLRLEKAVLYIQEKGDVQITVLAERAGFGDNPQYFSQVFKKYLGCTPSEYKRKFTIA